MEKGNVWDKEAQEWNKHLFYSKEGTFMKWFFNIAKKSSKILDQGCGVGQYALTCYKYGYESAVGVDFSKKLIKEAKKNSKKLGYQIKFIVGDIRKMPFEKNTFDIIISGGIIEHVPESEKTISEISRVLKKEGYLLIHVPHKISIFTIIKKIQQFLGIWKIGYEKSFTKKEIILLLKKNGFQIEEYYLAPFKTGKHKILGGILEIIDKPLYALGYGGHHISFLCKKIK